MKRTRAQNPKLQDPQDPSAAANPAPTPKPQRKAKQPRQPKTASGAGGKKASAAAAAREAAAAEAAAPASSLVSVKVEMAPVVPDVCGTGGGGVAEVAGGLPADWDAMDGGNVSPWWTFGVEEEKLLGWFPFVEEDFGGCHGGGGGLREPEPAAFDDDIWRIHQIYEIPSYAAK